ncbi:Flp pilus assembly complex ATPase component TadA [Candidatus Woesearchaeota archaeon]|nr:Flp pilus assembly complex ATPase component TadA [Candidatus Woesearchaeota archaeon]
MAIPPTGSPREAADRYKGRPAGLPSDTKDLQKIHGINIEDLDDSSFTLDDLLEAVQLPEGKIADLQRIANQYHIFPLGPLGEKPGEFFIAIADKVNGKATDFERIRMEISAIEDVIPDIGAGTTKYLQMNEQQFGELVRLCLNEEERKAYIEGREQDGTSIKESMLSMIANARRQGASDIHLIPVPEERNVRYQLALRVDGILEPQRLWYTKERAEALIGALISRTDIDPTKKDPQRDMFHFSEEDLGESYGHLRDTNIRLSIINSVLGRSAVMRILETSGREFTINAVGCNDQEQDQIELLLTSAHGLILVSGPTGSGKTTTLYSMLSALNTGKRKIMTLEDPVEYILAGLVQTTVKSDRMGFYLEHLLQQDPDVVLIGEIRDRDSAKAALDAANTGHTVFGTVHANYALSSIQRLYDLDVERSVLADTLRGVIAQRLHRVICDECKRPSAWEKAIAQWGVKLDIVQTQGVQVYEATGKVNEGEKEKTCTHCLGRGYQGRSVLMEILLPSGQVQDAIMSNAPYKELVRIAEQEGMIGLPIKGIIKVLNGMTTLQEVERVLGRSEVVLAADKISAYLAKRFPRP